MEKFLFLFVIALYVTCSYFVYAEGPSRIINGTPATENQFRYMISLQRIANVSTATRGHRCGGALVTLQHAVTTASCTFDVVGNHTEPISPILYRVFGGSVLLTNDSSPDRIRYITNITRHPEFNTTIVSSNPLPNDIAVITLRTPFLNNTVARLPMVQIDLVNVTSCTFSGWGAQGSPATISTQLMHIRKWTVNQNLCASIVNSTLVTSMVCAWNSSITQGAAGCPGDEGSPLVCFGGVVGLLIKSSNCSSVSNGPQIYTRVSNYSTWISSVVAQSLSPSTQAPQTTLPATSPVTSPVTLPTPTTPGGAATFQPGVTVLAVIAIAQIISVNVMNKS